MAMNLSFTKLPWYGQVGAFAVLVIAGGGVFWTYYAQPARASIDSRRGELSAVQAEIVKAQNTARRLPQFRGEVADLEGQLERLKAVLPEEKDVGDLLRRIQGMATQSNLTIRGFTPQAVATRQMHAEWPIGLELEGTYHNLGQFLERVSKFPRIINVGNINIKAFENAPAGVTITAQCTATTFVLLANPAPPPAAAKAGD